jgi:hypothetical protein
MSTNLMKKENKFCNFFFIALVSIVLFFFGKMIQSSRSSETMEPTILIIGFLICATFFIYQTDLFKEFGGYDPKDLNVDNQIVFLNDILHSSNILSVWKILERECCANADADEGKEEKRGTNSQRDDSQSDSKLIKEIKIYYKKINPDLPFPLGFAYKDLTVLRKNMQTVVEQIESEINKWKNWKTDVDSAGDSAVKEKLNTNIEKWTEMATINRETIGKLSRWILLIEDQPTFLQEYQNWQLYFLKK